MFPGITGDCENCAETSNHHSAIFDLLKHFPAAHSLFLIVWAYEPVGAEPERPPPTPPAGTMTSFWKKVPRRRDGEPSAHISSSRYIAPKVERRLQVAETQVRASNFVIISKQLTQY